MIRDKRVEHLDWMRRGEVRLNEVRLVDDMSNEVGLVDVKFNEVGLGDDKKEN